MPSDSGSTLIKHMPTIRAMVHPAKFMRYQTAGDYLETATGWHIFVANLPDWRMEACLLVHELVEMILTTHNGIAWQDIDNFDIDNQQLDDPGACPKAPYHKEHLAAEVIEKQLALLLGIEWDKYLSAQDALFEGVK